MAEINVLHPFREGNGRTQREFIRTLAEQAGYALSWSAVHPKELLNASIESTIDTKNLSNLIEKCIQPHSKDQQQKMTLKEVLKLGQGVPALHEFNAQDLHKKVEQFQFINDRGKEVLSFQFQGEHNQLRSIFLQHIPFLSKETKDAMIDQQAAGVEIQLNKEWER